MPIVKSQGITASERLLTQLCDSTFLGFWSYANAHRNQGAGKEICDLIVVCGRHVILFSDKSCAFPNTGHLNRDWSRWFRKSISKSVDQVLGAERWLKDHPTRVFLDNKCTQPLPIPFDKTRASQFHRIVVALGAKERCKRHRGGSGSLILAPSVDDIHAQPFVIGSLGSDPGHIHVLDEYTLPLVLQHLDTVADFIAYLEFKEALFRSNKVGTIPGEENLLALFLSDYVHTGHWQEQLDQVKDGAALCLNDGAWRLFTETNLYRESRDIADKSRVWDRIIQEFATHAFEGTLVPGSQETVAANELMLRTMALEPRLARLFLTATMLERCSHHAPGVVNYRVVASPTHADTLYAFVFVPNSFDDPAEYRSTRQDYLRQYCFLVAYKRRTFRHVFGIATESGDEPYRTFDILTFEASQWTPKADAIAREIQLELGVSGDATVHTLASDPPAPPARPRRKQPIRAEPHRREGKVGRNDSCPCGSGKKFKKCCLLRAR